MAITVFGSGWQLCLSLLACYIVYSLGRAIYNLYLHPLAKYPGPKLRAAFYFPDFWHIFRGTQHEVNLELHKKYGNVVRVVPDGLSFNCASAWQDIYGFQKNKRQLPKDRDFFVGAPPDIPSILHSNDVDHARIRRTVAHAFSESALREQEPLLTSYFRLLTQKLSSKIDGPDKGVVDMTQWYSFIIFDVVADLITGKSLDLLRNEAFDFWTQMIFSGVKPLRFIRVMHGYTLARWFMNAVLALPPIDNIRVRHITFATDKAEARLESKTDRRDIMSYIAREHRKDPTMTREEIKLTAALIMIAGSETTATVLTGATYFLARDQEVQKRAREEVRQAFKSADEISLKSTAQLPYLAAVIQEALRCYPAVPVSFPRRTNMDEGHWINGDYVPPDISVGTQHWATYMDPKNFCEPDTFAPERWLKDAPAKYQDDKRDALQPFHVGPRNCIGSNLAQFELRSILAWMLYHFDMELCEESMGWRKQRTFIFWEKPPLKVRLSHARI